MHKHMLEDKILVLACGAHKEVIRFMPPLNMREELFRKALDRLAEGFAACNK
jgi:4-aminobutyrate aminotransferase-like enzyme